MSDEENKELNQPEEDQPPSEETAEESGSGPEDGTVDPESAELAESEDDVEEGEEEEVEFDLEAQITEFRKQIEEEPENCLHHYNLGEALMENGQLEAAQEEFNLALEYDLDGEFSAIIHFALGDRHYQKLLSEIQGTVVRSSVGLHSAHKAGCTITEVHSENYENPIMEFEKAIEFLPQLKADDDIVEYVSHNAPQQIADTYYKWASDLIDKSRQIDLYGDEIKDVQEALKHLKKTLNISPNHSQANLMVKYAKKMLQEGWKAYDEYGFEAKDIQGVG